MSLQALIRKELEVMKTGATPSAVPFSLRGYLRVYGSVRLHGMFAVNSEYGRID